MPTKEPSFFKKVISSVKDLEQYPEMATKPFKSVVKYLFKLLLIFTLIVTIVSLTRTYKQINSSMKYIQNKLPEFTFKDNELNVNSDKAIEIEPEDSNSLIDLIIIDTNNIEQETIDSYIKDISKNDTGIVLLKDQLIANLGNGTIIYPYEKLNDTYHIGDVTKETLADYFSGTNLILFYTGIFAITFISMFFAYFTSIAIDVLSLAIIGHFTALVLRIRLRFSAMAKIAMHALTLPIILDAIYVIEQAIFGYTAKYFEIMYIGIAYIYIVSAILMVKSDLIKRGEELTKIIEEEEKVKEALEEERQKEEEEKRRKEEQKEKERQRKKEKEKEQEGNKQQKESEPKKRRVRRKKADNDEEDTPQGENA